MSSDSIDTLIQLGHDIMAHKYHGLATGMILFYDYFLTLDDEIKYAWSGKKSWIFWLFIFNRYFPVTWQLWQLGVAYSPQSQLDLKVCAKTAWYSLVVFVICTLLAQVVLTARIYAMTMKNIPVAIGFGVITASQFVLGTWVIITVAMGEGQTLPPLPLDAFHLCVFERHRPMEVAYTSISLFYDLLAFSLFIYLAKRWRVRFNVRMILDTIAVDATWYFIVIFSSHLVLVLTLNLARPTIQLLPAPGLIVYLPVMVSRIILSLKKAAALPQHGRSLSTKPASGETGPWSVRAFSPQRDVTTWRGGDGVSFDAFHEA